MTVVVLSMLAAAGTIAEQRPPTAHEAATDTCVGRWTGFAVDDHGDGVRSRPYGVTLELTGGDRCGTIAYDLGCGGYLRDCTFDGGGFTAVEEYTHNPPGACAPAGRIAGSCTATAMAWRWTTMGAAAVPTSAATLTRADAPPPAPPPRPPVAGCGCVTQDTGWGPGGWLALAWLASRRRTADPRPEDT